MQLHPFNNSKIAHVTLTMPLLGLMSCFTHSKDITIAAKLKKPHETDHTPNRGDLSTPGQNLP